MVKKTIFISLLFLGLGPLNAQNSFNGTIEYSLTDTGDFMKYFKDYTPSKIYNYFSNGNVAMDTEGGFMDIARFLYPQNKNEAIIIVDSFKLYNKVGLEDPLKKMVEKMEETAEIMGHTCQQYKISVNEEENHYSYLVWVATDMPATTSEILEISGSELFLKDLPYAILKVETVAGFHYEATRISNELPDPALFKIPKGYKLEKRLFRKAEEQKKE